MITTLTLNPAIDKTVVVQTAKLGSVNRILRTHEDMGGKGINVARVLQALGSEVVASGFIGNRNLDVARGLMDRSFIDNRLWPVDGHTRQNIKLIEARTGTTTDLNEAGFYVTPDDLRSLLDIVKQLSQNSSWLIASGSVPPGLPDSVYQTLLRQRPASCQGVLDADGEWLINGLTAAPYLIKPNIDELANACGRSFKSFDAIIGAARGIIDRYGVTLVLVSMGKAGSILVTADQAFHADALEVRVRNTVGAGDSMLAGFVHALENGRTLCDALAFATACGALAVAGEHAGCVNRAEAGRLAGEVILQELFPI